MGRVGGAFVVLKSEAWPHLAHQPIQIACLEAAQGQQDGAESLDLRLGALKFSSSVDKCPCADVPPMNGVCAWRVSAPLLVCSLPKQRAASHRRLHRLHRRVHRLRCGRKHCT